MKRKPCPTKAIRSRREARGKIPWDLDSKTLRAAWFRYHDKPLAERTEPFGRWFARQYYIQGLISWPWLEEETNNVSVYLNLLDMCKE